MPFGIAAAAVGAAGAIGGAVISSQAAGKAANQQEQAAQNATQAQLYMYNQDQANIKPQIQLGQGASSILTNLLEGKGGNYTNFVNSPQYKFAVQQGDAAINKQAAAEGNEFSSSTIGALSGYNQNQAYNGYQQYVQNLMQAAGLGNAAGGTVAQAGTATGQGVAASGIYGGNAAAQGTINSGNAFSNALQSSAGQFGNSGLGTGFGNLMSGLNWNGTFTPTFNTGDGGVGNLGDMGNIQLSGAAAGDF
jgi:hypothetical protein